MKKNLKTTWNVFIAVVTILGLTAKVKKDIITHRGHGGHNPCECYSECYLCLFRR